MICCWLWETLMLGLAFCAVNGLTVMNTWYEKKDIYKYTWQHPGSKMWHCIDYILMRQSQRTFYQDVSVIRWAEYWTDHRLLQAKIAASQDYFVVQVFGSLTTCEMSLCCL